MKRILLIDDDSALQRDDTKASFKRQGIEVVFCQTKDDGIKEINSGKRFDLVVLDWHLEALDDSSMSKLMLQHINKRIFIPVFIWSHFINDVHEAIANHEIQYPSRLIVALSKDDFEPAKLGEQITTWLNQSTVARISKTYRDAIQNHLEAVFYDLGDLSEGDIALVLRSVVGTDQNLDWSTDFILNLLHRRIVCDNDFTLKLTELMRSVPGETLPTERDPRNRLINKILYFKGSSSCIHCGDIVKIIFEGGARMGVIFTPDCDMEQKNTRYLDMVGLRSLDDAELGLTVGRKQSIREQNTPSYSLFPSIDQTGNGEFADFVAIM